MGDGQRLVPSYRGTQVPYACRNTTVVGSCLLSPVHQHHSPRANLGRLAPTPPCPLGLGGSLGKSLRRRVLSHRTRPLLSQGCLVVACVCRKRSFLAHTESTQPLLLRYQSHRISDSGRLPCASVRPFPRLALKATCSSFPVHPLAGASSPSKRPSSIP